MKGKSLAGIVLGLFLGNTTPGCVADTRPLHETFVPEPHETAEMELPRFEFQKPVQESPQNGLIYFVGNDSDGVRQIYSIDPNNFQDEPTQITQGEENIYEITVSPNTKDLAFRRGSDFRLYETSLEDIANERLVTEREAMDPSYGADGSLYFAGVDESGQWQVYTTNLNGEETQVTYGDSRSTGPTECGNSVVYAVGNSPRGLKNTDGSEISIRRTLLDDPECDPQGGIFMSRNSDGDDNWHVSYVSEMGAEPVAVTNPSEVSAGGPFISPDGNYLGHIERPDVYSPDSSLVVTSSTGLEVMRLNNAVYAVWGAKQD